jgi:hypothetical protein
MLRLYCTCNRQHLTTTRGGTSQHVTSDVWYTATNETSRKNSVWTSQQSYGSIHIPLQGVLQEIGAGPSIWQLISSPLINMLHTQQGFGCQSSNILSDESYTFACYTYVDDIDLIHNGNDTTTNRIISDMQRMLDHWADGLRATGGALVPAQSYWYGIDFKWNQKKVNWEYKSIAELPGSLILRDHLQQPTTLRRMEVTQAKETLGLWIAADGNQIAQMQVLWLLVERWIDKICTKQLTKTEA